LIDERFEKIISLIDEIRQDTSIPEHMRNNLQYSKRDIIQVYTNLKNHKEK
jgi:uncharacterized protein (UPF0147 family)